MRRQKARKGTLDRFRGLTIITAYAGPCQGSGWANRPLWVICRDSNGILREECLQPEEQSPEMIALYDTNAVCSQEMARFCAFWLDIGRRH